MARVSWATSTAASLRVAARFAVAGDFDGDGRDEMAIAQDTAGTRGNDFWVMDYDPATRRWSHLTPAPAWTTTPTSTARSRTCGPGSPSSGTSTATGGPRWRSLRTLGGTRGNDFWVMDYDPTARLWVHLGPAARGPGDQATSTAARRRSAPRFAVAGDFDGDGRDEVAVAQTVSGTRGNDLWVLDYDPAPRSFPGDRLLYTAHYGAPFDPDARQCALLLDEWTEIIPVDDRHDRDRRALRPTRHPAAADAAARRAAGADRSMVVGRPGRPR